VSNVLSKFKYQASTVAGPNVAIAATAAMSPEPSNTD
jgi:hypothetical protein